MRSGVWVRRPEASRSRSNQDVIFTVECFDLPMSRFAHGAKPATARAVLLITVV